MSDLFAAARGGSVRWRGVLAMPAVGLLALVCSGAMGAEAVRRPDLAPPKPNLAAGQMLAASQPGCRRRTGRGWAPTEHFARLKAWEVVAQATGNWPIQGDEFRAARYKCRADGGGRLCLVLVDVCRAA